jgi:hypothetical protein
MDSERKETANYYDSTTPIPSCETAESSQPSNRPPSLAARHGSSRPLSSFGHAACACDRTGWRRCDCQGPRYRQGLCRSSQGKPRSRTSLVSHLAHNLAVLASSYMHACMHLSMLCLTACHRNKTQGTLALPGGYVRTPSIDAANKRPSSYFLYTPMSCPLSHPNLTPTPLLLWRYVVTWKCTKVGKTVPSAKSRKRWISI